MPRKQLTEEGVRKLSPPTTGQVDYFDTVTKGLVLRVNYGGRKSWRALYYVKRRNTDGKKMSLPRTFKLGEYPMLNLAQARERARAFLLDPHKALTRASTGSFREVGEQFIELHVIENKLRSQYEINRCLNKYVYPTWGDRPFMDIRRSDVTVLLEKIKREHGPAQAAVVLSMIRSLMYWYARRSDDYVMPIVRGMNPIKNMAATSRERFLSDDEIRALWAATADGETFSSFTRVLLLCAQRRHKVATMKWADLKDGAWTIPWEEKEKYNAGSLRLPPAILDIIARQPRIAGCPYVFAAAQGKGPINAFDRYKARLGAKLPPGMPPWVLHDLRRTARSLLSRAGLRPDISERVLGHKIRGVMGVYDRHSYDDEKADALIRLAALVATIINPPTGNIVALQGRKRGRAKSGGR
jgi:integrase